VCGRFDARIGGGAGMVGEFDVLGGWGLRGWHSLTTDAATSPSTSYEGLARDAARSAASTHADKSETRENSAGVFRAGGRSWGW